MGSEKPTTCPECGSSDIRWEYSAIKKNNVVDGRLKLNEASLIGYLGCDGCSHTLRTLPIEQAVESHIQAEVVRLREALTPSADTKAAYIGEFQFDIMLTDDFGKERPHEVTVPWTTIKEIMAAIAARAALVPAKETP